MNPLLEVSELSGFKMFTSGANVNDDYFSYSEKESASLLEALLGSSLQEPLSPIVNTIPMGSLVVSPAIELESSVDMPISRSPTVTCSGCRLFFPLALPLPETDDISQPPDEVIKKLSVKVILVKEEKTYLVRNVCVSMMKRFLSDAFGIEDIQEFGYFAKKKVWLREDDELSTVVRDLLVKGKGALWCVEKRADNEPTQPHETPGASKRLKTMIMEDRRAHVEAIYQEFKSKHGGKYSGP